MSRVYDNWRLKNPIPEFDECVKFYDYVAVDKITGRRDPNTLVDHSTGNPAAVVFPSFVGPRNSGQSSE